MRSPGPTAPGGQAPVTRITDQHWRLLNTLSPRIAERLMENTMNSKANASNGNTVVDSLTELALNLDWSWSHSADDLWRQLDPELWGLAHNPWVILQTVSRERLETVSSTPQFQRTLDEVLETR